MLKWEKIKEKNASPARTMSRAKVYGGWLVEHATLKRGKGWNFSITFIPDPEHKWDLSN